MTTPGSVASWRVDGAMRTVARRDVFVHDSGPPAGSPGSSRSAPVLVLHGFPGSSHDWAAVVPLLAEHRRVLLLDLPGYGFSTKDPGGDYSLFTQADVVEALLADLGVDRCVLVAHDMGDTVAAELLARSTEGRLGFEVEHTVLTNGSIFIDLARLTRGQRLTLRLPGRALPFGLPTVVLRRSLKESFAPGAPPPAGAVEAMIALLRHERGDRLLPRLIRYIEERRRHQDRWTAGLVDHAAPLTLLWGELDPIAVVEMTTHLAGLRPDTEVRTFPDVGHWPSVEAPSLLAAEILSVLDPRCT